MSKKREFNSLILVLAGLLLLTGCASSPLVIASGRGDALVVNELLDAGANANELDGMTAYTPLIIAAEKGNVEIVKLLIARGADVNLMRYWFTAMGQAARKGHYEVVDILLDNGANVEWTISSLNKMVEFQAGGDPGLITECQKVIAQLKQREKLVARRKGWVCYSKGEFEKGITFFKQAIQQEPTDAGAFTGLAACHDSLRQYDEAVLAAKQAVALSPQAAFGHLRLGQVYWHKKQFIDAEKELKLAIELEPNNPEAYVLARYYLETGQYQESLQLWNKVAGILPDQSSLKSVIQQGVMISFYALGKYDEAIAAADQLVNLSTLNGIGFILNKQNNSPPQITAFISGYVEGLEIGDYITRVNGRFTSGMDLPTVIQRLRGPVGTEAQLTISRKGCAKPINSVVRRKTILCPEAALGYAVKSLAYREKANSGQAEEFAIKAVELKSDNMESHLAAGVVSLDKGKFVEAIKELSPYPTNNIFLATAYAKSGQFDGATKIYQDYCDDVHLQKSVPGAKARKEFLVAMKSYATKLIDKAKQLEDSQQLELAIAELARVLPVVDDERVEAVRLKMFALAQRCQPKEPEDVYRYSKRGDILLAEGNFNGAIAEYNRALRLAPYSPRLYFNAALIHGSLKNYAMAIQYMNTYVQFVPNAPNIQAAKDALIGWELKMEKR